MTTNPDNDQHLTTWPNTAWPRAGVSIAVFRGGEVLLIERGKGAFKGLWSLPGGHVEPGETVRAAALRELAEETGVTAEIAGLVDICDVILREPDGSLGAHYVLSVFAGRWISGEPLAASDVRDACFVAPANFANYRLTDGAEAIIARARQIVDAG